MESKIENPKSKIDRLLAYRRLWLLGLEVFALDQLTKYWINARLPFGSYGPGAGIEIFLSDLWSIDGSYRYLCNEDINSQDAAHPPGRNFSDKGFMLTAALNRRF